MQSLQFKFNVQHDCFAAGCGATGVQHVVQERVESTQTIPVIVHEDNPRYIINLYALHNASRLRRHLPRSITRPRHIHEDRVLFHSDLAQSLRVTQGHKRSETKEKTAATRAQNKRKRAIQEGTKSRDKGNSYSSDEGSDESS